jgi:hypothetical protein
MYKWFKQPNIIIAVLTLPGYSMAGRLYWTKCPIISSKMMGSNMYIYSMGLVVQERHSLL